MTKVVTLSPRFVLKSRLPEDISFREQGGTTSSTLKAGELAPLRFIRRGAARQLCLRFPGDKNQWYFITTFHSGNRANVAAYLLQVRAI
jgi:vacuolar protein sorting-associated protein 13A/C